ncbi:MAG: DUF2971 domain-containing protein [Candidatus Lokiarchaeota archaeon]|nr:DUF2971 domain-containing protein [Candidatus Lokiarchaeota archaeon]
MIYCLTIGLFKINRSIFIKSNELMLFLQIYQSETKIMKLIKFSSYNQYLLEGLTNQTLFFSSIYNFNDPFEGVFRYKISADYSKFKDFYLNHYRGREDKLDYYFNNKIEFEKLLNQTFDWRYENNGVCCFSHGSKKTDILMWANYADNHKGLCLVFKKDKLAFHGILLNNTAISDPTGPHEITYTHKYLDEDPLNRKLTIETFLTTKFDIWINENEFRYISPKPGNYVFNIESLHEIIFGLRTSPSAIKTIKNIYRNQDKIKYKQIVLSDDKFGFRLKEI